MLILSRKPHIETPSIVLDQIAVNSVAQAYPVTSYIHCTLFVKKKKSPSKEEKLALYLEGRSLDMYF